VQTADKVNLLRERFVHRTDVFANQWFEEKRGHGYTPARTGQCPENCGKSNCRHRAFEPLTSQHIVEHLQGKRTIGVYALGEDSTTKWLCLDIDATKGADTDQETIQALTYELGKKISFTLPRQFLVENSGSRGYHVWVFFDKPVAADKVVALGHYFVSLVTPPEGTHIEVYPKTDRVPSLGSLVKMPLGVHRKTDTRCFFVKGTYEPHDDQWSVLANVEPVTEDHLDALIEGLGIEVMPAPTFTDNGDGVSRYALPCFTRLMHEGCQMGERDEATFKLAIYLKSQGLSADMTLSALETWNEKNDPPYNLIERKVESAYSNTYSYLPCQTQALDKYCSSNCYFWHGKTQRRGYKNPQQAVGKISRD
jgi:hypothetical protein